MNDVLTALEKEIEQREEYQTIAKTKNARTKGDLMAETMVHPRGVR